MDRTPRNSATGPGTELYSTFGSRRGQVPKSTGRDNRDSRDPHWNFPWHGISLPALPYQIWLKVRKGSTVPER